MVIFHCRVSFFPVGVWIEVYMKKHLSWSMTGTQQGERGLCLLVQTRKGMGLDVRQICRKLPLWDVQMWCVGASWGLGKAVRVFWRKDRSNGWAALQARFCLIKKGDFVVSWQLNICVMKIPLPWKNDLIWLVFFNWVETTNPEFNPDYFDPFPSIFPIPRSEN